MSALLHQQAELALLVSLPQLPPSQLPPSFAGNALVLTSDDLSFGFLLLTINNIKWFQGQTRWWQRPKYLISLNFPMWYDIMQSTDRNDYDLKTSELFNSRVEPNFSPNNMHCLWCTRRILLTRCPPNILQCKYHSDLIDMRASRIYVEICYSIEIDISIGLYQTGLKGIPAKMYSVAKTKYMLNTNWCLIGFLTKLIISSLIEDGLLVPAFSFKGNKCTNIRKTESFVRRFSFKRCHTDEQWLTLSKLEVVTSMKGEGGQKERNPLRTWKRFVCA